MSPAKLRKDLSFLGSYGTRGVGYEVSVLIDQIGAELGISSEWPVVIVGVGHLGHALANYGGFASRGFRLVALFDDDPQLVGTEVAGLVVRPSADLPEVTQTEGVLIGVVATPASAAQQVADALVAAGVQQHPELRPCRAHACRRRSTCAGSTSPVSCRSSRSTSSGAPTTLGQVAP